MALEHDPKFKTVDERVAEFIRQTALSRATYFNTKKSLKTEGSLEQPEVPRFMLTGLPPDTPNLEVAVKAVSEEERAEQQRIKEQEEQDYKDMEDKIFGDEDEDEDE
jgi:hypothetical protein